MEEEEKVEGATHSGATPNLCHVHPVSLSACLLAMLMWGRGANGLLQPSFPLEHLDWVTRGSACHWRIR